MKIIYNKLTYINYICIFTYQQHPTIVLPNEIERNVLSIEMIPIIRKVQKSKSTFAVTKLTT